MKNYLKTIAAFGLLILAGCAKEMPLQAEAQNTIQGAWDYVSTDGQDLADYGIQYRFDGTKWTYQLGDAGSKMYSIVTDGDHFTATLEQDGLNSGEAAGSQFTGTYQIAGDSLTMNYGGHTAVLVRAN
jgi:uncharacterized protein (TIGR03067 family)